MKKKLTYDLALKELQEIVAEIQSETVGVDDLLKRVKRASELIQFCKETLRKTEEALNNTLE
ncbi:MAG: exodeoxyribonuclease VII small subunit [Bacteroidetes bacterium]|nr:MAG: exodeoxyribonuclease VII small subunit [Bacteroidota bacterium]